MVAQRTLREGDLVQEALELRHDLQELSERCRRLYEEANDIVERLRQLHAAMDAQDATRGADLSGALHAGA